MLGDGETHPPQQPAGRERTRGDRVSIFVWTMVGIAFWHAAVLVPDRFWGGIVGAFAAAVAGGLASGYALPEPGIPTENPPGVGEALWAMPGATVALVASYLYGAYRDRQQGIERH
jgi:hypothetical protein